MKTIIRYAIQRKSDGKVYKKATAIYPTIESYWDNDTNKARLWIYKPETSMFEWMDETKAKDFRVLTFKFELK